MLLLCHICTNQLISEPLLNRMLLARMPSGSIFDKPTFVVGRGATREDLGSNSGVTYVPQRRLVPMHQMPQNKCISMMPARGPQTIIYLLMVLTLVASKVPKTEFFEVSGLGVAAATRLTVGNPGMQGYLMLPEAADATRGC